jgi:hypothetical protein
LGGSIRRHASRHRRPRRHPAWVELFIEAVEAHFEGPTADAAKARAVGLAKALRRLLEGGSASGDEAVQVTFTKA